MVQKAIYNPGALPGESIICYTSFGNHILWNDDANGIFKTAIGLVGGNGNVEPEKEVYSIT